MVNFALFKIANSFEFINEYGYLYYNNTSSITNSIKNNEKSHDELVTIMNLFNLTKDSVDVKYVVYELNTRWNLTIYNGLKDIINKEYAKKLLNLLLKCKYIQRDDNLKIKFLLKDLL